MINVSFCWSVDAGLSLCRNPWENIANDFFLTSLTVMGKFVVLGLSSSDMDTMTRVQILDEADCISNSTNNFGKGMNPIILTPAMSK